MFALGCFHYFMGVLCLFLTVSGFLMDPVAFGGAFRQNCPAALSFLLALSDRTIGIGFTIFMVFRSLTEFFLGWNWCRKARRTARQTLTLVLSGGKVIYALCAVLAGSFAATLRVNRFSLALNAVTFLLALWVHLHPLQLAAEPEEAA